MTLIRTLAFATLLPGLAWGQLTPRTTRLNTLPATSALTGTEGVPCDQVGPTRRCTMEPVFGAMQAADVPAAARRDDAIGNGATSDSVAVNDMLLAAYTAGTSVELPAGRYYVPTNAPIVLRPGVRLRGAGPGRTVFLCDDTVAGSQGCFTNVGAAGDYDVGDFTMEGVADTHPTDATQIFSIYNAGRVHLHNIESRYSRLMGFSLQHNVSVLADGVSVYRSMRDGIAAWDTPDVQVVNSHFEGVNDDAVSAHTNNAIAAPNRSSVIVANNTFVESQGISVLGAKQVTITGNNFRRMMAYCVYIGTPTLFVQGDTPSFAVKITDNQMEDVFKRPEPAAATNLQSYIYVAGPPRHGGATAAAPGDPGTPLLGTGMGTLYLQGITNNALASPGNRWFDISGNTMIRTLPASSAYADWGYGAALWVGANSSTGFWTGGIPEANLQTDAVVLLGPVRNSRIDRNLIETTGQSGVLSNSPLADGDLDGLSISGNKFYGFGIAAVNMGSGALTNQRMILGDNEFDGDPQKSHPNRGMRSTWRANGWPAAIYLPNMAGVLIERNKTHNVAQSLLQIGAGLNPQRDNLEFGTFTAEVFSPSNIGIGRPQVQGEGWSWITEDADGHITALPYSVGNLQGIGTRATLFQVRMAGGIGLELLDTASAANNVRITPSISGGGPSVYAVGTDMNISLVIAGKGVGQIYAGSQIQATAGISVTGPFVTPLGTPASSSASCVMGPGPFSSNYWVPRASS